MRYCQEKGVVCQYAGTNMHCRLSACIFPKESLYPTASEGGHLMDIENLLKELRRAERYCLNDYSRMAGEASTALSTFQAENEKLREKIEDARLEGYVKGLGEMSAELEQVIAERGTLIEDFVDYVTDGVPNPAIFCKNRCNKCVDMRGWCTGKNCKGFYPSVASGQKEG